MVGSVLIRVSGCRSQRFICMDDPQSSSTTSNPEEPPQGRLLVLESRLHTSASKPTGNTLRRFFCFYCD